MFTLVLKLLLVLLIFLKVTGRVRIAFKDSKAASAGISFQKPLLPKYTGFRKVLVLTNFCRFLMKPAAAFVNREVQVLLAFRIYFITLRNYGVFTRSN